MSLASLLDWQVLMITLQKKAKEKKEKDNKKTIVQADDLISFRQFAKKALGDSEDVSSDDNWFHTWADMTHEYSLMQICLVPLAPRRFATTLSPSLVGWCNLLVSHCASWIKHFLANQTTASPGFSDSVYAEACVTVHQFDIVLG
jgi:vesicle coat complex subunit